MLDQGHGLNKVVIAKEEVAIIIKILKLQSKAGEV